MTQIAKRKAHESWRDAVASRAREARVPAALEAFDGLLRAGNREAEAAYRALAQYGLLWRHPAPGQPPRAETPEAHDVPDV
jgi:hypothetical protein